MPDNTRELHVRLDAGVLKELEYIVQLHQESGAPNPMGSVGELVTFVLGYVAYGSRRPGSGERQLLEPMGLVSGSPMHLVYRAGYGASYE